MSFLFINAYELSALAGLPYIQQSAYLLGIRPHMDSLTFLVGVKRKISYQSLAEALYVEPHQGLEYSGSPSRQQLRRIINGLERVGLIAIQSCGMQLILKCLLAEQDRSVQNKPDTNPTYQADTNPTQKNAVTSRGSEVIHKKADTGKQAKADIPHNSNNYYLFLCAQFKKFWMLYPNKKAQQSTWEAFQKINPDEALAKHILDALEAQIKKTEELQAAGLWVPAWKYPVNWLAQHCWNDELIPITTMEQKNAKHSRHSAKKSAAEIFSESCGHAPFEFEEEPTAHTNPSNVVQFRAP